ncbi:hypothetical protein VP1G_03865 [Cytospora mali]|uniref:THOC5 family protein n=1 Tax=Cytospora mali TaxID=578113 RepID=A0A194UXR2_CYTMA|nr:hypothetical protein VP1G_03865 [Valsa mali var. pyri (nom. inval.)]
MDQPQTSMTPADGPDGLKATASPPERKHPTHRARAPHQHRQHQQQPRRPISSLTTQPIPHATMTIDAITAEARQEVDVLHLQLQNLYYEQRHLQGEIAACESFDHEYQKLPLVPVEEFLSKHPEHVGSDENALMIARIEDERAEREGLEQQRQELLKRKQKLIAENKKRREDLANLDNDLEKFIDAAKPIQKTFEKVV